MEPSTSNVSSLAEARTQASPDKQLANLREGFKKLGIAYDRMAIEWFGPGSFRIFEVTKDSHSPNNPMLAGRTLDVVKVVYFNATTNPEVPGQMNFSAHQLPFAESEIQISPQTGQWLRKLSVVGQLHLLSLISEMTKRMKETAQAQRRYFDR